MSCSVLICSINPKRPLDMAEKREHSTHVRLCDASDAMLSFLAESKGEDKSKIAADPVRDKPRRSGRGRIVRTA